MACPACRGLVIPLVLSITFEPLVAHCCCAVPLPARPQLLEVHASAVVLAYGNLCRPLLQLPEIHHYEQQRSPASHLHIRRTRQLLTVSLLCARRYTLYRNPL